MDENMSLIKQENDEKDTRKIDGKYIFVPEGYMPVIIPINGDSTNSISILNSNSYPETKFNASIPNSHPNSQINSPSLNKTFIGPGEDDDPSEILKQKNAAHIQSVISELMEKKKEADITNDDNNEIIDEDSKIKKDKKIKKIPRPKNSFIFYLKDKTPEFLKINPNINRREVSKVVGQMWRNESEEVKKIYAEKARIELEEHKLKYPNYKFQPDRSKKTKKNGDDIKKTAKEIKKTLRHQRTSSEDLSLLKNKITKKTTSRQRSISNSVFQSKKLEEIYNENKMEYDQELENPENNHDLYQTLINSLPLAIAGSSDPQPSLDMTSNIINTNNDSLDDSLDPNLYDYDYDSSLIDTDYASSYFDELSLSSYNNSLSESLTSSNEPINFINSSNTDGLINVTNPLITRPSAILPLDADPSSLNVNNSEILINDTFNALLPYQTQMINDLSNSLVVKSHDNIDSTITSTDILPPSVNDIITNKSIHSPDFDAIITSNIDSVDTGDIESFNLADNADLLLSNGLDPTVFTELTNTIIPDSIPMNTVIEPTITVPSNDFPNKSRRLSQLQQKNNLTIVTSTENLEELPESIDVFEQPSSATTSTTKNSTASNINSNNIDSSNINTSSYLLSKMTLMDKFNALNLYSSNKYKNSIHARSRRHHHHHRSHSQCNSASVAVDRKTNISSVYPLSASIGHSGHHQNTPYDYLDKPIIINGFEINSATGSTPSTYSGTNSAATNNSYPHSFGFTMDIESPHDNSEAHSSNSSIHSTTRTSSSIMKKSKSVGIKFNTLKKTSSLSKLNSSSNSLLPTPESHDSSSVSASISSSSSSLCLNLAELQALSLEPALVVYPQTTSSIDFLTLGVENNEINDYTVNYTSQQQ